MSWEALAWAKDSDIAHPVAKFILVLLANKADENFSCYPSIRTLMAESGAGRSTILRALSYLETRGLMSRRPQFHDSGARRSTPCVTGLSETAAVANHRYRARQDHHFP
ncbi:helix-turn-helix domain-containing protein [Mycobacterium servetii]|uniref:Helix-turn-helix domain-containing protein n=1 Tax=Mycobacterium servetii TaxID=3237418 RepID=A0ABV4C5B2_9MYCO